MLTKRSRAVILGGAENMAGQICPSCGETTILFPPAPPGESIWTRIPKLASVPFSAQAARDADRGQPVMITRAVPQQVAACQLVAREIQAALTAADGNSGPARRAGLQPPRPQPRTGLATAAPAAHRT